MHCVLQPQCKYELFHIKNFTSFHWMGRYELNKLTLAPNVWLHSSVSRASYRYHRGHGFESHWNPDFFRLLSNCINWKIYSNDMNSNKLTLLPMCGFITQLAEHCSAIAEVTGSNHIKTLIFFRLLLSNCLNWKIYCDDHSSLSFTTAVQIWIISYKKTSHKCSGITT